MLISSPPNAPPGASLQLDNAHGYLDRVIRELHGLPTSNKHPMVDVLQYLSEHIRQTRRELGALRPKGDRAIFASTADELEEIVAETARAAEAIETLMPQVDKSVADALLAAVTRILRSQRVSGHHRPEDHQDHPVRPGYREQDRHAGARVQRAGRCADWGGACRRRSAAQRAATRRRSQFAG